VSGHEAWLQRLYSLAARLAGCGTCADLACMSLADLWGMYRFLSRIANEA
jgi:hypothetical protein